MTAALDRAAETLHSCLYFVADNPWSEVQRAMHESLAAALDVDELTEILARRQWDLLPLVISGEMPPWDEVGQAPGKRMSDFERDGFRRRARPFAEAIRAGLLGEAG